MRLKVIIAAILILPFVSACTKEDVASKDYPQEQITINPQIAMRDFAEILSQALAGSEDLRQFLKNEALKEFDKDYDVFYPFVSNTVVDGTNTFKNILLKYCNPDYLENITMALPKLTMLVPDYSWVDENCFSVKTWDTSLSSIAVGYDESGDSHHLFLDGELIDDFPANAVPSFPVIIVKSNERIKASFSTKSGQTVYEFADPAFDGSRSPHTRGNNWAWGDETTIYKNSSDSTDIVSKVGDTISASTLSALSQDTIDAYNEFGLGWNGGVQRDLIYYGMSKSNTNYGIHNNFKAEMLYRFAIPLVNLKDICDDSKDPKWSEDYYALQTPDGGWSFDRVLNHLWANGNYEIKLNFLYFDREDNLVNVEDGITLTISPRDLMYVRKNSRRFIWRIFGNTETTFAIIENSVEPKWYYPGDHGHFICLHNNWNLASYSDNVKVIATEFDADKEITYEDEVTVKTTNSVSTSLSAGATIEIVKVDLNVTGTHSQENETKKKAIVKTKEGADPLEFCYVDYIDNVITYKDGENYQLKRYDTGKLFFTLIPIDKRNEYFIRQGVLNRTPRY
ncbi:MAG: hypothetical protein K6E37_07060 [Bacteroidales bacterium]|nr:hypothetical protein [Bacteroidales bacterium]